MYKRKVFFNSRRPVISFSFDDFPHSALEHGGGILESYNLRGTFYVSAGLCGTSGPSGAIATHEDLIRCIKRGHELACHTYDHMNCAAHLGQEIAASMEKNQAMVKAVAGTALEHFAYPYGSMSLTTKKNAINHYTSARSVRRGINRGIIDLGCLKACAFYSRLGLHAWQPYLQSLAIKPGWLIFYTHDVSTSPSSYGCTLQELHAVIACALRMGYIVLPVGDVIHRLTKDLE
jgi:peptidoglycan/xylan/chitin deacetylase (PgdA/CDA1 family)